MRFEVLLALLPVALAAPLLTPRAGTVIKDRYIVKLKDSAISTASNIALSLLPNAPAHVYNLGNFRGFAAEFDATVLSLLQALPIVSLVLKI
jgi:hypothetical protein